MSDADRRSPSYIGLLKEPPRTLHSLDAALLLQSFSSPTVNTSINHFTTGLENKGFDIEGVTNFGSNYSNRMVSLPNERSTSFGNVISTHDRCASESHQNDLLSQFVDNTSSIYSKQPSSLPSSFQNRPRQDTPNCSPKLTQANLSIIKSNFFNFERRQSSGSSSSADQFPVDHVNHDYKIVLEKPKINGNDLNCVNGDNSDSDISDNIFHEDELTTNCKNKIKPKTSSFTAEKTVTKVPKRVPVKYLYKNHINRLNDIEDRIEGKSLRLNEFHSLEDLVVSCIRRHEDNSYFTLHRDANKPYNNPSQLSKQSQLLSIDKNKHTIQTTSDREIFESSIENKESKTESDDREEQKTKCKMSTNPAKENSLQETMVQVGGVASVTPVHAHTSVLVSTVTSCSTTAGTVNVPRSSVMMIPGQKPGNKVSSVSVPAAVSALTKVSSVRIVPTPVGTPTPSVCGASETSSTQGRGIINITGLRSNVSANNNNNVSVNSGVDNSIYVTSRPSVIVTPVTGHLINCRNLPHVADNENGNNTGLNVERNVVNSIPSGGTETTAPPPVVQCPNSPQGNTTDNQGVSGEERTRRGDRERRRERRERRRGRRALRLGGGGSAGGQTELVNGVDGILHQLPPNPQTHAHDNRLPDLLNSHVPPPYSTLPSGPGAPRLIGPSGAPPHPIPLHLPPPPPGAPIPPGYPPPGPPTPGSPLRPATDNPWPFFGSRR